MTPCETIIDLIEVAAGDPIAAAKEDRKRVAQNRRWVI